MKTIHQKFQVNYQYPVIFTEHLFEKDNLVFKNLITNDGDLRQRKALFIIDRGVESKHPELIGQIKAYVSQYPKYFIADIDPILIPGGEEAKNQPELVETLLEKINDIALCRHSYIVGIGGGAVLDVVGYVAAIAHRGIRHIRVPTTVLSQNDSGIGVKNSINYFDKKNFIGTFAPPYAVINDAFFLTTLEERDWRSGIAEAIKVALIKDQDFFRFIQANAQNLVNRHMPTMKELIFRCAEMHLEHIAGGDPFEMGTSRPLDFGHWASHKLEQLTHYELKHGEAVAIGIALDSTYSYLSDLLTKSELDEIINLTKIIGFDLYIDKLSQNLSQPDRPDSLLYGLKEFREHLGGELTIMLLQRIGCGIEVNHMDHQRIAEAVSMLKSYHPELAKC